MKSIIIVVSLVLIPYISVAQAKEKSQADYQNNRVGTLDITKNEFNVKKNNTANLVRGKSMDVMLKFYGYYLQENDISRADSLMSNITQSTNEVFYRYKMSLISYNYTSDPKSQLLFVSDSSRIKEYRAYFLKSGISSLKSNNDIRAHYLDLVALDVAYYKIAQDSVTRKQMAGHYNSLAWYSIITQKLDDVEYYLNQSLTYDPESKYPVSNMPLLLLLKGKYEEAEALYIKLKDQPFAESNSTFKDEFLEDLRLVKAEGITIDNEQKIRKILEAKQ